MRPRTCPHQKSQLPSGILYRENRLPHRLAQRRHHNQHQHPEDQATEDRTIHHHTPAGYRRLIPDDDTTSSDSPTHIEAHEEAPPTEEGGLSATEQRAHLLHALASPEGSLALAGQHHGFDHIKLPHPLAHLNTQQEEPHSIQPATHLPDPGTGTEDESTPTKPQPEPADPQHALQMVRMTAQGSTTPPDPTTPTEAPQIPQGVAIRVRIDHTAHSTAVEVAQARNAVMAATLDAMMQAAIPFSVTPTATHTAIDTFDVAPPT
jgi:hypothetical protein